MKIQLATGIDLGVTSVSQMYRSTETDDGEFAYTINILIRNPEKSLDEYKQMFTNDSVKSIAVKSSTDKTLSTMAGSEVFAVSQDFTDADVTVSIAIK